MVLLVTIPSHGKSKSSILYLIAKKSISRITQTIGGCRRCKRILIGCTTFFPDDLESSDESTKKRLPTTPSTESEEGYTPFN
ncbi:hypothetical protein CEXT_747211, partial [Caerostris extrusa]